MLCRLSKIISGILKDLYGIKRLDMDKQVDVIQKYDSQLVEWRGEISDFLDLPNPDVMITVFRRQHTVLLLAFSHAMILLHRPALLRKTATLPGNHDSQTNPPQDKRSSSVWKCMEAAGRIVSKLRELTEKKQMYQAFWVRMQDLVRWHHTDYAEVHSLLRVFGTCRALHLCHTEPL